MAKSPTMLNTLHGSLIEHFYPAGWDLRQMDRCCAMGLKKVMTPTRHWNTDFKPVAVSSVGGMDEWVPSSWMPTLAGRLFFFKPQGGPLVPDAH